MKKLLAAVSIVIAGLACGPDVNLNERTLFTNGGNTLTFLVYDALTGAGLEDATVNVHIGPYVIPAEHTTGNAYVASRLPPSTGAGHLVVIDAPGHLQFLGQAQATGSFTPQSPAQQAYTTYQVALYSSTSVTDNVTVRAFDAQTGAPIANGSLVAQLVSSSFIGPSFSNQLPGAFTLRPNVITVNFNAQGTAVLPNTSLVLGAEYALDVYNARNAQNVYLQPATNTSIEVGYDPNTVTLFLSPPSQNVRALSTNNENANTVVQRLEVKFPYPVELCSTSADHTWTRIGIDGDADGQVATPDPTTPVTATLIDNGHQLNLVPNYSVPVDTGDGETKVQFNGVQVRASGSPGCQSLSSVALRNSGSFVVTTITVQAP